MSRISDDKANSSAEIIDLHDALKAMALLPLEYPEHLTYLGRAKKTMDALLQAEKQSGLGAAQAGCHGRAETSVEEMEEEE